MSAETRAKDEKRLKYSITKFAGVAEADYDTCNYTKALKRDGITRFNQHFINLSVEDIQQLKYEVTDGTTTSLVSLTIVEKRFLQMIASFYQEASATLGGPVDISTVSKDDFTEFRVNTYQPGEIVNWQKRIAAKKPEDSLGTWKKTMKPSVGDYKECRDEHNFTLWSKKFKTTVRAHALSHLIDESYTVPDKDKELDRAQMDWLFKVIQDKMILPAGKAIVDAHENTMDTRMLWKALVDHFSKSTVTEIRSQTLSTWITSTRLAEGGWNGSHQNYIYKCSKAYKDYNEISAEPFTDSQCVQFLSNSLIGVPHLETVLITDRTSRRVTGNTSKITLEEYVQLLSQAAALYDSRNSSRKVGRKAHVSEFQGEEDNYQATIHDMDTDVEDLLEVFRTDNRGSSTNRPTRPARMDFATWKSLSEADQKEWDKVSDDGKIKILNYAKKKGSNDQQRSVNGHELVFEEASEEQDEEDQVQVSVHKMTDSDADTIVSSNKSRTKSNGTKAKPKGSDDIIASVTKIGDTSTSLLNMASRKGTKPTPNSQGVDINFALSQKNKNQKGKRPSRPAKKRPQSKPYQPKVTEIKVNKPSNSKPFKPSSSTSVKVNQDEPLYYGDVLDSAAYSAAVENLADSGDGFVPTGQRNDFESSIDKEIGGKPDLIQSLEEAVLNQEIGKEHPSVISGGLSPPKREVTNNFNPVFAPAQPLSTTEAVPSAHGSPPILTTMPKMDGDMPPPPPISPIFGSINELKREKKKATMPPPPPVLPVGPVFAKVQPVATFKKVPKPVVEENVIVIDDSQPPLFKTEGELSSGIYIFYVHLLYLLTY